MANKEKSRPVGELVFTPDRLECVEPHYKNWDEFWRGALAKLPELDTQDQVTRFIEANRPFVKALVDGITFFQVTLKELERGNADKVFINSSNMFVCAIQMQRGSNETRCQGGHCDEMGRVGRSRVVLFQPLLRCVVGKP